LKVYADTSGIFAFLVSNDRNNPLAAMCLKRLLAEEAELVTTSYVVVETCALLQARVGVEAVRAFEGDFRPLLRVRWIDEAIHRRIMRRWCALGRRDVSVVDCAGFVIMEDQEITRFFGYDKHFEEQGFTGV
jgi:predicted nucleic acid-binding protein